MAGVGIGAGVGAVWSCRAAAYKLRLAHSNFAAGICCGVNGSFMSTAMNFMCGVSPLLHLGLDQMLVTTDSLLSLLALSPHAKNAYSF